MGVCLGVTGVMPEPKRLSSIIFKQPIGLGRGSWAFMWGYRVGAADAR